MALDFPLNPTIGQTYTASGVTFVWSGVIWYTPQAPVFATNADAVAGVIADRVMTPAAFKAALDARPPPASATPVGTPTAITRARDTNFQNILGRPMFINVIAGVNSSNDGTLQILIGPTNPASIILYSISHRRNARASCSFAVPTGWWYRARNVTGSGQAGGWWEYT